MAGIIYLYPQDPYARQVFEAVVPLAVPNQGFMSGIYEATGEPNTILTGNTNGLILEILYYKARGHVPILAQALVTFASDHLEPQYASRCSPEPLATVPPVTFPVAPLGAPLLSPYSDFDCSTRDATDSSPTS